MPYDKDGKYYRKPVFNENFKGLKKKPLKKEYKQNKIILKLVFACLRVLVYLGTRWVFYMEFKFFYLYLIKN